MIWFISRTHHFLYKSERTLKECFQEFILLGTFHLKKKESHLPSNLSQGRHVIVPGRVCRYHQRNDVHSTVDGSEIRRSPVEVGSLSHYLQGFSTIPGGTGFLPQTVPPTQHYSLLMKLQPADRSPEVLLELKLSARWMD